MNPGHTGRKLLAIIAGTNMPQPEPEAPVDDQALSPRDLAAARWIPATPSLRHVGANCAFESSRQHLVEKRSELESMPDTLGVAYGEAKQCEAGVNRCGSYCCVISA